MRAVAALLAAATTTHGELWLEGERLRAARLRRAVAVTLAAQGLEQPEGNIVAAGADGGVPHTSGGDERVLRAGESIVVDLYPKGLLFADCTRTFCVGRAPAALVDAHATVREVLAAAHATALPGERGWTMQEAACERLAERGWPTPITQPGTTRGYVHGLGHGVGFELHEYPSFRRHAGAEGTLGVGDVFTLEPGLYDPDAGFGVRLEDLVTLGNDGPENLTPLPYDLDPRAW
jgi:Xaa-Pro aminopeptidase